MGQLYAYRGILPSVATTAVLFPTTEITGDVVVGARCVVEPGAIVCDGSVLGPGCVVRAGSVVKQRS